MTLDERRRLHEAEGLADLCSRAGAVCGRGLLAEVEHLAAQLRDARAEIETETQRLTTRMGRIEDTLRARLNDAHAEIVSWRNAYEGAVQRAEQAESDLRQAKAQHAIDESELVENTVKAHVQQMNVIGAELAAERAKVERVKALLYEPLNHDVLRRALTGDEQGE